ncbi:MAG: transcription termination factor NusA [Clostridia bacterium]|nr:transcription termination factor NusA [Clostridia bacterium]
MSELMEALEALEAEKNIKKEVMCEALETALATAYKKNFGQNCNVEAQVDRKTGAFKVCSLKDVVEEVVDDDTQISLEDARRLNKKYSIGDIVEFEADPMKFGRIAAQTAKQMIVQKIREAERGNLFDEYADKENNIMVGKVEKRDKRGILIDVGAAEAILAPAEQIPGEQYRQGAVIKVYVIEVKKTTRSLQLIVSRTHPGLVKRFFENEVPEISDGTVTIKGIAREAGSRTKIAVCSEVENVDPVGACVGPKGARVAAIVDELCGEKIDIIPYSDDAARYISSALSPAQVISVTLDEEEKSARVSVPESQLSLAIGKEGQNARLAARLTGWKIDIKPGEEQ